MGTLGLRAGLSVPIITRDEAYGTLTVNFFNPPESTDVDIQPLSTPADSAAVAINNARFIEETEQARDEATQLQEVTAQLASTTDMGSILDLISTKAKELLKGDICAITRYDEDRGGLVLPSAIAGVNSELGEAYVLPRGAGTARWAT